MTTILLPSDVLFLIQTLESNGFEGWIVGGCVRDCLLGKTPKDWDITTNALPEQVKNCFSNYPIIETGIKHGTVSVLIHKKLYEITTYRVDGTYLNHRKPESVYYTRNLKEDLSRRDFTINAMAYHPQFGLVDYFGGQNDLAHKILRCVGTPKKRFEEDALRILRAIRFQSVFGFSFDSATEQALVGTKDLLAWIAPERKREELLSFLEGDYVCDVICRFPLILDQLIPGFSEMNGFEQHNPHHIDSVLVHTAKSVAFAPNIPLIRLTMLFHDIGKPSCFSVDENGIGHFYGHAKIGEAIARDILISLRFDNVTKESVCTLIRYHDVLIEPTEKAVRRWFRRIGPELFFSLMEVKKADTFAQAPKYHDRIADILNLIRIAETVMEKDACFSLKQLNINGTTLIQMGIPQGKQIGQILSELLSAVIDEKCPNDLESLQSYVRQHFIP